MSKTKWVGFDFDETLRRYDDTPIEAMVVIAKSYLESGIEIRIISARFAPDRDSPWIMSNGGPDQERVVQDWCEVHLGIRPACQWGKSPGMIKFYDDKAVRVMANTGIDLYATLHAAARKIKRGCDCEYDYRCGNCEDVVSLHNLLEKLEAP
jgi:hypothetical protein